MFKYAGGNSNDTQTWRVGEKGTESSQNWTQADNKNNLRLFEESDYKEEVEPDEDSQSSNSDCELQHIMVDIKKLKVMRELVEKNR